MDERALLYSESGRQQFRDGPDLTGGARAVERMEAGQNDGARPERSKDSLRTFEEYRDVLRRVDSHIAEAECDPPLQGFWRGVGHEYREEADRLSRSIGEETVPLSMIEFWGEAEPRSSIPPHIEE